MDKMNPETIRQIDFILCTVLAVGGATLFLFFFLDMLKGAEKVALMAIDIAEENYKAKSMPKRPIDPGDWWKDGDNGFPGRN